MLTKQEAVNYFGSQRELAEALKITPNAVYLWKDLVPKQRAFQLEVITQGKLRASGTQA